MARRGVPGLAGERSASGPTGRGGRPGPVLRPGQSGGMDRRLLCPVCPTCRHVLASVPPPQDIFGRREHRAERCPFDPDHKLVGLAEAIELGLVEEDGYGFWRPCRRGVPTWIRQLSPFRISIEEARSR